MAKFLRPPNTYGARILRFADGDTVLLLIRVRFGLWAEKYVRLVGIESYELDGPDKARAVAIRNELDRLLEGRGCLVHLRSEALDRYGRLCGSITVGETDLAAELVAKRFAWFCSKKQSIAEHAAKVVVPAAVGAVAVGCYTSRDASTLIVQSGSGGRSGTNSAAAVRQSIEAAQHASSQLPSHIGLWILAGLAAVALVAAVIWVIHNRATLIGKLAVLGAKL